MNEKFNIQSIPSLVVVSSSCEIINFDGITDINVACKESLHRWSQGKCLFWSRQAREDEYTWETTTCTRCYMNPLIGSRHSCTYCDYDINLCETCLSNYEHEHPLIEFLIPTRNYSFEHLFTTVSYLLSSNNEEKIETNTMWKDDIKAIGFYFSAQWCPSHRAFTPKLVELYKQMQESCDDTFRLVFISCDRDEKSFDEYRLTMPWPAIPFKSGAILKTYFNLSGQFFFS